MAAVSRTVDGQSLSDLDHRCGSIATDGDMPQRFRCVANMYVRGLGSHHVIFPCVAADDKTQHGAAFAIARRRSVGLSTRPMTLSLSCRFCVATARRRLGYHGQDRWRIRGLLARRVEPIDNALRSELHCGIVLVGETGAEGYLTQCVPDDAALKRKPRVCSRGGQPATNPARRYDRCGSGLGCVATADGTNRCKRLCALRTRGRCGKSELCVLPSPVTGVGSCSALTTVSRSFLKPAAAKPKRRHAAFVLRPGRRQRHRHGLLWSRQRYGDSRRRPGRAACERSWNCQSGFCLHHAQQA